MREAVEIASGVEHSSITFDTDGVFAGPQTIELSYAQFGELKIDSDVVLNGPDPQPASRMVPPSGTNFRNG